MKDAFAAALRSRGSCRATAFHCLLLRCLADCRDADCDRNRRAGSACRCGRDETSDPQRCGGQEPVYSRGTERRAVPAALQARLLAALQGSVQAELSQHLQGARSSARCSVQAAVLQAYRVGNDLQEHQGRHHLRSYRSARSGWRGSPTAWASDTLAEAAEHGERLGASGRDTAGGNRSGMGADCVAIATHNNDQLEHHHVAYWRGRTIRFP